MKLNAQQMIDNLQQMQRTVAIIEAPDWKQAIRQSIEAIKACQLLKYSKDEVTAATCKAVFHE